MPSPDPSPAAQRQAARRIAARRAATGSAPLLVTDPTNVRYLTGFTGDSTVLLLWTEGRKRRALLVSDGRFETQLAEQCPGLDAVIRPPTVTMPQAIAEQIAVIGQTFAVEPAVMTLETFGKINGELAGLYGDDDGQGGGNGSNEDGSNEDGSSEEVRNKKSKPQTITAAQLNEAVSAASKSGRGGIWQGDADTVSIAKLRQIKDDSEIAAIRRAVATSERVFDYMRARLQPELSEFDLAADGEHVARQFGMTGWSFAAIVAAGDRAALPHYEPGDATVAGESHVLIDWGVREPGGYVSDMTRVLMRAQTPKKIESIYRAVHAAHDAAVAAIRPGTKASEVDQVARDVLAEAGYGKRFTHSLGHGIGLNVHEGPGLRPGSDDELAAGMVVTVEPGVYLPAYGGVRLENDVLVTEDGCESISTCDSLAIVASPGS